MAGQGAELGLVLRSLAPAMLPIALAYHLAHYLPSLLVERQYLLHAINDPMHTHLDWLGLGNRHVTTGFFNSIATVRPIWLTQAGLVVGGHVLSVLLGHALAVRVFGPRGGAARSQLPLACFMIAYTLFGLWLLATPRGT